MIHTDWLLVDLKLFMEICCFVFSMNVAKLDINTQIAKFIFRKDKRIKANHSAS